MPGESEDEMGYTVITTPRSFAGTNAGMMMRRLRPQARTRAELGDLLGLSAPSISRAIRALADAGLVAEAALPRPVNQFGRPELPVELDASRNLALGFAAGLARTVVAASDLRGAVLASRVVERPADLAAAAAAARSVLGQLPGARPLAAGLTAVTGVDLPGMAAALTGLLGLDVVAADRGLGVTLAALVEHYPVPGTGLFLHADDVEWGAMVLAMEAPDITSATALALNHFPAGAEGRCPCGRQGCLAAAVPPGSVSLPLPVSAARPLGEVVSRLRLMTRADHVFLVGEGFGSEPAWSRLTAEAREADRAVGGLRPVVLRGGTEAASACNVALLPFYEDPVGVISDGIEGVPRYRRAS
jgi:hypothetical protein